jgi:PAS domain-containing protein
MTARKNVTKGAKIGNGPSEAKLITTANRDISDRKRPGSQIRELKTFKELAHGFDLTHTIIREVHGKIRVWTRGAEELFGWTANEAIGPPHTTCYMLSRLSAWKKSKTSSGKTIAGSESSSWIQESARDFCGEPLGFAS